MPLLDYPRHEKFVQALAKGETQREAYRTAISTECTDDTADQEACRLANSPKVVARLAEVREILAKRAAISLERIAVEYAKIGFSDITQAVKWSNQLREPADAEAKDQMVLESAVLLTPSTDLHPDTSAAIAEVSQTAHGVKIKMHDKKGALDSLSRMLGGFVDKVEHTGKDGLPLAPPADPIEIARQVAFILESAARELPPETE